MSKININKCVNLVNELGWPLCSHYEMTMLYLSSTNKNPSRYYFRCFENDDDCQYFVWLDEFDKAVENNRQSKGYKFKTKRNLIINECKELNELDPRDWNINKVKSTLHKYSNDKFKLSSALSETKKDDDEYFSQIEEIEKFSDDTEQTNSANKNVKGKSKQHSKGDDINERKRKLYNLIDNDDESKDDDDEDENFGTLPRTPSPKSISSKKGNEIFENLNQIRNSIKDLIDLNQSLLEENAKLKKNKSYKKY